MKKFIIVDEELTPMVWSVYDNQLNYCYYSKGKVSDCKIYTEIQCKEYIAKTNAFRSKNDFPLLTYLLMPITI